MSLYVMTILSVICDISKLAKNSIHLDAMKTEDWACNDNGQ